VTRRKISIEILRDLFVIAVLLAVFVVVLIYFVGLTAGRSPTSFISPAVRPLFMRRD
jgi:hypothetical protein